MLWLILLALITLLIGTGTYAQGRSRIELTWIRPYVGAAFFVLLALAVLAVVLDL